MTTEMVRVELPYHLQNLARVGPEVSLEVCTPVTASAIPDAPEARYPMLCGTIRYHSQIRLTRPAASDTLGATAECLCLTLPGAFTLERNVSHRVMGVLRMF